MQYEKRSVRIKKNDTQCCTTTHASISTKNLILWILLTVNLLKSARQLAKIHRFCFSTCCGYKYCVLLGLYGKKLCMRGYPVQLCAKELTLCQALRLLLNLFGRFLLKWCDRFLRKKRACGITDYTFMGYIALRCDLDFTYSIATSKLLLSQRFIRVVTKATRVE